MSEVFVQSFEHLKGFPRADEALAILQRVASLVKPIMRKHQWRLPTLAEFFPETPNLLGLNVNMGQKIMLRLRPAFDKGAFLQEHEIMGTMLHELTHNVHGPHDQHFYKFLAGLEDELDALRRSGYAGEGFHSPGRRLGSGSNFARNVPPQVARLRALEAAEQRRRYESMLSSGGRLGGGSLADLGLTIRELSALAADMRMEDAKRCATGDKVRQDEEVERAKRDSIRTAGFELPDEDEIVVVDGPCTRGQGQSQDHSGQRISSYPQTSALNFDRPPPPINTASRPMPATLSTWTCPVCTLINDRASRSCQACDAPRLKQPEGSRASSKLAFAGSNVPRNGAASSYGGVVGDLPTWNCKVCGETGMEHEFWTCRWCGSVKEESSISA